MAWTLLVPRPVARMLVGDALSPLRRPPTRRCARRRNSVGPGGAPRSFSMILPHF